MGFLDPISKDDWSASGATHLLWRVGFGGTPQEIEAFFQKGFPGAIDSLFDQYHATDENFLTSVAQDRVEELAILEELKALPTDKPKGKGKEKEVKPAPSEATLRAAQTRRMVLDQNLQQWRHKTYQAYTQEWIRRTLLTTRPCVEKLTLFWHNYFAVSAEKTDPFGLYQYVELLRSKGVSNFGDLLLSISKDPAMLSHLDNVSNVKGHPNENYARELMELFSLGIGNYTEKDVLESARAFTGWGMDREKGQFVFREAQHDAGEKEYLGQKGAWDGGDIVRILLEQPACALYLARRIWAYFAYENPPEALVQEFAKKIRECKYDLKETFRTVFMSREFYSKQSIGVQVKTPIQLVAGSIRLLKVQEPPAALLAQTLKVMGMDLSYPPEVNGWPSGSRWINTSTLLMRYNFTNYLVNGELPSWTKRGRFGGGEGARRFTRLEPENLLGDLTFSSSRDVADYFIAHFIQRPINSALQEQLIRYLDTDKSGGSSSFQRGDKLASEKMRGLIHLILSSPDYQLC